MTATARQRADGTRSERRPADHYPTPGWVTRAILPYLPLAGSVLEPCAGDGAIVRELIAGGVNGDCIDAIELDPVRAKAIPSAVDVVVGDALSEEGGDLWDAPHGLVVINPPFSLAQRFVETALAAQRPHRGTTAALLRLAFLEGQGRADFHACYPSDVYVLPRRPSFTNNGKSDSSAYAWFVWSPGGGGRWRVLDCESAGRGARA
jgi:hypothetical protein